MDTAPAFAYTCLLYTSGEPLRFYACGGDGTVNEVANGIIGYDNAAMSVIPVGTGNDFLKNFGDDLDKFRDAENLWDGPQFPMDAIDVNGRVALTIACSGIDARVARDVHNFSESPILDGKSSYIVSLLSLIHILSAPHCGLSDGIRHDHPHQGQFR